MANVRENSLDQQLDIAGSLNKYDDLDLLNELNGVGLSTGQTGSSASVSGTGVVTVTGLTGMSQQSEGDFLLLSGAVNPSNEGYFKIVTYLDPTSVEIDNPAGSAESGLEWAAFYPYSLEDDLNFARTDRANIKGVRYYEPVPEYYKSNDLINSIPTNLKNIAGKTTDAKSFVVNKKFENAVVASTDTFITLSDPGQFRHATASNPTGVPVFDGYDAGNYGAVYASIFGAYTGDSLNVLTGPNTGHRIFGQTQAGGSTSPDSVELVFMSVADGYDVSTAIPYTWEAGQPTTIDIYYGYRDAIFDIDENAFRLTQINGAEGGSGGGGGGSFPFVPTQVGEILYCVFPGQYNRVMPVTGNTGWLVNSDGILVVVDLE